MPLLIRGDALGLQQGLAAEFRVVEQRLVVVMPGMAGLIGRRLRQCPVLADAPPMRLAFELRAVTGGAVFRAQGLLAADIPAIALVGRRTPRACHGKARTGRARSCDLHPGLHARGLVPEGVAVQKPFAGIVEHAEDVAALLRVNQGRVPVVAEGAVFPELVEMVAVQVDAVREGGVVAHGDPSRLAAREPAPRPFRKARPVIEGPEVAACVRPPMAPPCMTRVRAGRAVPVRRGHAGGRQGPDRSIGRRGARSPDGDGPEIVGTLAGLQGRTRPARPRRG